MNEVKLVGKVEAVSLKAMDKFMSCSLRVKTMTDLNLWVKVKNVQKLGKETKWIPELKGEYVLLAACASSYLKEEVPVYEVAVSKNDITRVSEELAQKLHLMGLSDSVVLKGQVKQSKHTADGRPFLQLGLRYFKPKTNESDYHYVRVACPEGTDLTRYGEKSYVLVLGVLVLGPDNKPTVKASLLS